MLKNEYFIKDGILHVRIKSNKYGEMISIFDEDDFERINGLGTIWVHLNPHTDSFYSVAQYPIHKQIWMHRFVMNTPRGYVVDHINHDTLDNRKSNLRNVKNAQNMQNKRLYKNSKTGIRGVHWNEEIKKWYADFRVNGKTHYVGSFDDVDEARKAVEKARSIHMPYSQDHLKEKGDQYASMS
jgi:hypothetical protein